MRFIWNGKYFYAKHNPTIRADKLGNIYGGGVIGAIIGSVVTGGATVAASAIASGSAEEQAEEQRQWQSEQYQPAKELQALQIQQYKNIGMPYEQSLYDLWKTYGQPQTEEQYKIFQEYGIPAEKALAGKISAGLEQPLQLPQDVWDKIWQQARERTLSEYAPVERMTTQRLAAKGGLEQGPADVLFKDIELSKTKSVESLAINQAIQEWTEKKTAQQQAYENVFKMLGYQPTTNVPATSTSAVGTIQPYVSVPAASYGVGEGISNALRFASLFTPTTTPTTSLQSGGAWGQYSNIPLSQLVTY